MNLEMDLICYGCGVTFEAGLFKPIRNLDFVKPSGGLWTSPVDCSWGWKEWGEQVGYSDFRTSFNLKFHGKVFEVDDAADLLGVKGETRGSMFSIDFEHLADRFDAFHLTARGEMATRFHDGLSLYGWDCETVLIFNPDSVRQVS